ncbi:hypothetical protein ABPG75_006579 [Micractinium tetrahymenae]
MPAPVILYDGSRYQASGATLDRLGNGEASIRFTEKLADFAGRYTAARLTSKADAACQFIVVSYHGRWTTLSAGAAKKDEQPTEAEQQHRDLRCKQHAKQFIKLVAETACRLGKSAVIGGDWNAALMDRYLPQHEDWELHLRTVGGFLPQEEDCKRYNQPCIDFFCTLWPLNSEEPSLLMVKHVRAHAHLLHAECYDHDPVLCNFLLAKAGAGCGLLPAGLSDAHQVPEQELKLLTTDQLRAALQAKSPGSSMPSTRSARRTLVKLLLFRPGVQYRHLSTPARQHLACLHWQGGAATAWTAGERPDEVPGEQQGFPAEQDNTAAEAVSAELDKLERQGKAAFRDVQALCKSMELPAKVKTEQMLSNLRTHTGRLQGLMELALLLQVACPLASPQHKAAASSSAPARSSSPQGTPSAPAAAQAAADSPPGTPAPAETAADNLPGTPAPAAAAAPEDHLPPAPTPEQAGPGSPLPSPALDAAVQIEPATPMQLAAAFGSPVWSPVPGTAPAGTALAMLLGTPGVDTPAQPSEPQAAPSPAAA